MSIGVPSWCAGGAHQERIGCLRDGLLPRAGEDVDDVLDILDLVEREGAALDAVAIRKALLVIYAALRL
jgi:hypothetical protein